LSSAHSQNISNRVSTITQATWILVTLYQYQEEKYNCKMQNGIIVLTKKEKGHCSYFSIKLQDEIEKMEEYIGLDLME